MKLILLASALAVAAPAMAQDQTTPPRRRSGRRLPAEHPAAARHAAARRSPDLPAGAAPDQAFPPPAPLAEYPICKKGQTDHCKQRVSPK